MIITICEANGVGTRLRHLPRAQALLSSLLQAGSIAKCRCSEILPGHCQLNLASAEWCGKGASRTGSASVWTIDRIHRPLQGAISSRILCAVVLSSQPGKRLATLQPTQAILDNSQSAYAQLLASSSLLKVVTEHTLRYTLHANLARLVTLFRLVNC